MKESALRCESQSPIKLNIVIVFCVNEHPPNLQVFLQIIIIPHIYIKQKHASTAT